MNGAHLHLLINHIPVLAVPCAVAILLVSLWRMNSTLQRTGFALLVVGGLSAWTADLTGDPAKDVLKQQMTTDYPRQAVRDHEQAADYGLVTAGVLGALAVGALWFARRGPLRRGPVVVLILGGLFVTTVLARVADLGGQIRHVEIRSGN